MNRGSASLTSTSVRSASLTSTSVRSASLPSASLGTSGTSGTSGASRAGGAGTTSGSARRGGLSGGRWLSAALLVLLAPGAAHVGGFGQHRSQASPRATEEQVIDVAISEMLAAWQLGNIQMLHNYFAEEVSVVSGAYEPPLQGWSNYVQAYQKQRERMKGVRLDRQNTYIIVRGNIAWVAYQWEFGAVVDGQPGLARGHTTLILEKRKEKWLIVHNHTSIVSEAGPAGAAPPSELPRQRP